MAPALYDIGYIVTYQEGDNSLQRTPIPPEILASENIYITSEGDTLLSISQKKYGDQFLWYLIADANPSIAEDIFDLPSNLSLIIPNKEILSIIYG